MSGTDTSPLSIENEPALPITMLLAPLIAPTGTTREIVRSELHLSAEDRQVPMKCVVAGERHAAGAGFLYAARRVVIAQIAGDQKVACVPFPVISKSSSRSISLVIRNSNRAACRWT